MNTMELETPAGLPSAAERLAEAVQALRLDRPLVVALPPGGMALAADLARLLHAPLDLLLVGSGRATVAAPAGLAVSPLRERAAVLVHGGADEAALHAALMAAHQLGALRVVLAVPDVAPALSPTLAVLVDDLVGLQGLVPVPASPTALGRPAPGAGLPPLQAPKRPAAGGHAAS